jgi:toxin CcdB
VTQFSLYKNQDKRSRNTYPYFVDVQNSLFSDLNSRLVIPFARPESINDSDVDRLCPAIPIHGKSHVLLTHQMTSVPISILSKEELLLEDYSYQILEAIDMLITGI